MGRGQKTPPFFGRSRSIKDDEWLYAAPRSAVPSSAAGWPAPRGAALSMLSWLSRAAKRLKGARWLCGLYECCEDAIMNMWRMRQEIKVQLMVVCTVTYMLLPSVQFRCGHFSGVVFLQLNVKCCVSSKKDDMRLPCTCRVSGGVNGRFGGKGSCLATQITRST